MSIMNAYRKTPPTGRRDEVAELRAQIEVLSERVNIPIEEVRSEALNRTKIVQTRTR